MYKRIKIILDIIFAWIGLIILSPLFVFLMILIRITSNEPIFFLHTRPGIKGKPIKIIKFRTMKSPLQNDKLTNIERISSIGHFLRKYSLDEIPQLINVIKGDLSLVGPRPLEMRYLDYYTKEQHRRHDVKPGITGLAQVNGRNSIQWEDKFNYDLYYVDNLSFSLDIKIIFSTIGKVIKRDGVNVDSQNTVIPFDNYMKNKNKENKL